MCYMSRMLMLNLESKFYELIFSLEKMFFYFLCSYMFGLGCDYNSGICFSY